MTERTTLVEMFDATGKPVSDPAQASRTVTSYFEDGKLVKRTRGKAVILVNVMQEGEGADRRV